MLAAAILYANVALLGRKRRPRGQIVHLLIRAAAMIVIAGAATVLAGGFGSRVDVTSEQIHSLSDDTRRVVANLDENRPVLIQAYLSPDVPRAYLDVRNNIVSFLRELDVLGRNKIETQVVETVKYSTEAREARERYGVQPFRVPVTEESAAVSNEIFLGLVFSGGTPQGRRPGNCCKAVRRVGLSNARTVAGLVDCCGAAQAI
jgi:ABC-2 type transport system permease protein